MEEWQISTILQPDNPVIVLLLICTLGATVWTYLTIDPLTPPIRSASLVTLRFVTLLLGVYLVMQPSLVITQTEPQPAPLAVIFDASGSMGFPENASRLNEAIDRAQRALLGQRESDDIYTHFFSIAETVRPHRKLSEITIHNKESAGTHLGEALKYVNKLQPEIPFAGVLLLSDGANTVPGMEATAKTLHLPINTVFIGNDSRRKDVLIKEIRVDEFAFSRKPNPVEVVLENHGLPLTQVEVTLYKSGKMLRQKTADLIDGHGKVTFHVVPRQPGTHIYTASIPNQPNEKYTGNNTRHVALNVVRDKYRVLHLSGFPSWDQRFVRDMLKEWPQIDLVSFYLLRTTYQSTTQSTAGLSLIPFPTDELFTQHLREFDIIIFQNFDPATVGVDPYLDQIAEYIEDGGALVLLGGETGLTAPSIANSKLAELLPASFMKANLPTNKLISDAPFSPVLTEAGNRHPLFSQSSQSVSPEELLRSLPRLNGIVKMKRMQKNGLALLAHNVQQIEDGPAPLISVSEAKNGRTLLIATDSLWNWRFTAALSGAPSTYYDRFWKQAVRWLTQSPDLARISLQILPPNTTTKDIQFHTTVFTTAYQPAAGVPLRIAIRWTDELEQEQSVRFTGTANNVGEYLLKWTPTGSGPHRITVSQPDAGLKAEQNFLVADKNAEMNHLTADGKLLKKVSVETGGVFIDDQFSIHDLKMNTGPRQKILSRRDYALWSHPLTLVALLGLLLLDWWLRKRRGIL